MTDLTNPDHAGLTAEESRVIQRLERIKAFYDVDMDELTKAMAAFQPMVKLEDVEKKAHLFNEYATVQEVFTEILREKMGQK